MDYLKILRDIEMKNIKPIYFLMGDEPYFIDLITEKMESDIIDEMSKSFCQTIVYGRDAQLDQVIGLAKSFPMMGDKQLVIVKEAQDLKFSTSKGGDEDIEKEKCWKIIHVFT
ncbi:MAG: hypothetical protein R2809_05375 [Flavobacteriales bacterium]